MDTMKSMLGKEVRIGDRDGEITNILGVGYEVAFYNLNDGKTYVDSREIEKYLVKNESKLDEMIYNAEKKTKEQSSKASMQHETVKNNDFERL